MPCRLVSAYAAAAPARASQRPKQSSSSTDVPLKTQLGFERHGHCVIRQSLPAESVQQLKRTVQEHAADKELTALQHRVRVLVSPKAAASCRDMADAKRLLAQHRVSVGFLQFFNLHRSCPQVLELAQQLAPMAAQLLGTPKLRLYQDCLFLKNAGFSDTNWHSDLRMAPFDTSAALTAWVPLTSILRRDSSLQFAVGSHRDFALPYWHDMEAGADLSGRYSIASTGCMAVGDVSWHHGWTLHAAGPQPAGSPPRLALSLTYFADGTRLLPRKVLQQRVHGEDRESYSAWLKHLKDGAVARHPLLPLVHGSPHMT